MRGLVLVGLAPTVVVVYYARGGQCRPSFHRGSCAGEIRRPCVKWHVRLCFRVTRMRCGSRASYGSAVGGRGGGKRRASLNLTTVSGKRNL